MAHGRTRCARRHQAKGLEAWVPFFADARPNWSTEQSTADLLGGSSPADVPNNRHRCRTVSAQPGLELRGGHWPSEEVALRHVAAMAAQAIGNSPCFYAFRRYLHAQTMPELDSTANDVVVLGLRMTSATNARSSLISSTGSKAR